MTANAHQRYFDLPVSIFVYPHHPSMLLEYKPEFGSEDEPQSQLEELPRELSELDLGSIEGFLRASGMMGMRFENRIGGFVP
mmetsp:Transcript_24863/g.45769  ORF Transcript_24863/g.45769 Transcript_24863/m.45769 type:complete len:82 (+) Transcript_24863:62-307(+)